MFGRRVTLFKLLGFEVRIDISWTIIAVLITWSLASGFFPHYYKNLSAGTYLLMGVMGALGLFASIVVHELSHSLIARKFGLPMKGITLFIFGGVAEMEDEPPSAQAEFFMAIAGPLTSIFIGFVCHGVYIWAQKNGLNGYKNVKLSKGEAEKLPFEDNFFDAVAGSFVLCSVNSLDIAMKEIKRVLKPGGKLVFLEHIRSENKIVGILQNILAKPYSWVAKNCHPNRNPVLLLNNDIFDLSTKIQIPYILSKLVFAEAYEKEV